MSLPQVVSREQWLVARRELLAREKELTRQRDALNADRRRLPMVKVEKEYVFQGPDGRATLALDGGDLGGRPCATGIRPRTEVSQARARSAERRCAKATRA